MWAVQPLALGDKHHNNSPGWQYMDRIVMEDKCCFLSLLIPELIELNSWTLIKDNLPFYYKLEPLYFIVISWKEILKNKFQIPRELFSTINF